MNRPASAGDQKGESMTAERAVPSRQAIRSFNSVLSALCALALTAALLPATGARAEIIKVDDMLRGVTVTRAQCMATGQTVWVRVHDRDFCVRYYLSTAGGEGRRPVVFLQGDKFGQLNTKTWTWNDLGNTKDIDTDNLMRSADSFSKRAKTTAIYLARIGVDGTSGNHTARKTVLELHLMNAALDAIKQRHGFEGFHLAGQSGGSKLIGGLIALRNDIACAVPGAGPLSSAKPVVPSADPSRSFFDPAQNIPQLVQKRGMRIIVLTDPQDKKVSANSQSTFVARLRQAGGQVEQYFVEATDENRHGVVEFASLAMGGCVLGRSSAEIARAISTMTARNTEWNAMRAAEAGAANRSAQRLPARDLTTAPGSPQRGRPGPQG